jgi:hypothetical protein
MLMKDLKYHNIGHLYEENSMITHFSAKSPAFRVKFEKLSSMLD